MARADVDATLRLGEESEVQVEPTPFVGGLDERGGTRGDEHLGKSQRAVGDVGACMVVVKTEDVCFARRRSHRGRQASRRHAKVRRRTRRRADAQHQLEEGRSTAAAAVLQVTASQSRAARQQWQQAMSTLRWRRLQSVWVSWMGDQRSEATADASAERSASKQQTGSTDTAETMADPLNAVSARKYRSCGAAAAL